LKSHYQLIVIGAGPAGSYAAWTAAKAGVDVLLLERNREVGFPLACAEAVSLEGLSRFVDPDASFISSEVNSLAITVATGYNYTWRMAAVIGYVLDRPAFDGFLADRAVEGGAELKTGAIAYSLELTKDKPAAVAVKSDDGDMTVTAEYVIAADGVESMIGRMAGIETRLELDQCESSLQYRVSGIQLDPNCLEFCVGKKYARDGYLWVFPKSDHSANIGLGFNPAANDVSELRECLDNFLQERYGKYTVEFESCGMVPKFIGFEILGRDRLLLAGDAARTIDSLTGAGICRALHTGQLAAGTVIAAVNGAIGNYEIVSHYTEAAERELGRDLRFFKMVHRIFRKFDDEDWESLAVFLEEFMPQQKTGSFDPAVLVKMALTGTPRLMRLARHLF